MHQAAGQLLTSKPAAQASERRLKQAATHASRLLLLLLPMFMPLQARGAALALRRALPTKAALGGQQGLLHVLQTLRCAGPATAKQRVTDRHHDTAAATAQSMRILIAARRVSIAAAGGGAAAS